jgi:hypothetical protein
MENMINEVVNKKWDLSHIVNIVTLTMCGMTLIGYVIYMTWCIANFVSDIDKRLSLQQQQIAQISDDVKDISQRLEK